ncbi:MAG TPA: Tex family protein [Blastocatellia bacterium]|nr:Tex family protein [Blastocatellia bacterium]
MDYSQKIATQLGLRAGQVKSAIELLDQGNTVPFIARYRKEITGALDEEQLRQVATQVENLRTLDERRQTILDSIEEQGKLTPELRQQVITAETRNALEDLYQPFKPKRRTRASVAREKGLSGLADLILQQGRADGGISRIVAAYITAEVPDEAEALAGARDIVAETISDNPAVRQRTRDKALKWAMLRSERIKNSEDARGVFETYYDFQCLVDRIQPYQTLAINRGETEKVLRVQVEVAERDWRSAVQSAFRVEYRSPWVEQLELAIDDAAKRLLLPAIERDVRQYLSDKAEEHAIAVFAKNLSGLLTQPPLAGRTVLGLDPGFRTGCKVAVVDPTGKVLETTTIYPHQPQPQWAKSLEALAELVTKYKVSLIAIGNGTASRETEQLAAELIKKTTGSISLSYLIVNEAGASIYSASPLARAELPDLDVTLRGAVSIARRVQDPLAELVKIDPQSIGVGLYQHDVNQTKLSQSLTSVVETVVNRVGVDANTASPALLTYVAGVGPKLAERIVSFRNENGPFRNRRQLLKVSGLGPKAFEQAAGFLRVRGGDNPLDGSAIHPESYDAAEKVLKTAGLTKDSPPAARQTALDNLKEKQSIEQLAAQLQTGVHTLTDIMEQLVRPGRDPRMDVPAPILRNDVLKMEDLKPGMRLPGTVRNVVDFGAFVDIGVKQDGLLHRSQVPSGTALSVGAIIEVEIIRVEMDRGRISLGWAAAGSRDQGPGIRENSQ